MVRLTAGGHEGSKHQVDQEIPGEISELVSKKLFKGLILIHSI